MSLRIVSPTHILPIEYFCFPEKNSNTFFPLLVFFQKMMWLNLASNFLFSLILTKSLTNSKLFWNLPFFNGRNDSDKKFIMSVLILLLPSLFIIYLWRLNYLGKSPWKTVVKVWKFYVAPLSTFCSSHCVGEICFDLQCRWKCKALICDVMEGHVSSLADT